MFFPEEPNSGAALFRFYLDILTFSEREDSRRPGSDLVSYSGKPNLKPIMTVDWEMVWHQRANQDKGLQWLRQELVSSTAELG